MRRHGGFQWISTPLLSRKGSGTRPAFTAQLRLEILVEARQQSNRRKMVLFDRRRDRPTNEVVPEVEANRRNPLRSTGLKAELIKTCLACYTYGQSTAAASDLKISTHDSEFDFYAPSVVDDSLVSADFPRFGPQRPFTRERR